MTGLTPYLFLDGTAREALTFYQGVFGGELVLHTYADFGRDTRPDAIAHGMLNGPVDLFATDADEGDASLRVDGLLFALLGTAEPAVLEEWFADLAEGGEILDPLQVRPWGDHDGQVRDRFGVTWLIGYQG
ncbi:VOC family protein [Propioniciclava coleopterorum]|uniref:VOC family protein n=1 Tax=Propioniciclava coleopterorum TaxID=2714937 RepID=A0A6G7Y6M3_9ACTN|nr:VOC family protein [Propioniciclava coleopterorum]QIK72544.1 VOC family protein [Propioniciclava coleopterorum]